MTRAEAARRAGWTALGALALFGGLAGYLASSDGAALFSDGTLLRWSVDHRPGTAASLARGLTDTGTSVVPYALAVLAGLILGRNGRQRLLGVGLCLACLSVGQLLRYTTMDLVARPRPPRADWAAHASHWAFPSGHTTTAALTAGLLIIAVLVRAPRGATPVALVIGCWGAAVGLTRIYLGVHWFTDVIGGWLLATGWLGVCFWAVARWMPERLFTRLPDAATGQGDRRAPEDPDR